MHEYELLVRELSSLPMMNPFQERIVVLWQKHQEEKTSSSRNALIQALLDTQLAGAIALPQSQRESLSQSIVSLQKALLEEKIG